MSADALGIIIIIKIIIVAFIHKDGPWYRNVVALNISNNFIEMLAQCIGYCRFKTICRIIFLWPFIFLWHTSIIKELIWIEGRGKQILDAVIQIRPRPKAECYFTCKNHHIPHWWTDWMDGFTGWIECMEWMVGLNEWIERIE